MDTIDANLKHPNEDIQRAAVDALASLMESYFPVTEKGPSTRLQTRVVDKYTRLVLQSNHPAETRGYSLALGALPKKLLAPSSKVLNTVLDCLCRRARPSSKVAKEGDAETRRNCTEALCRVIETVGFEQSRSSDDHADDNPILPYPFHPLNKDQTTKIIDSFLLSLSDYNVDRRGDVGSWSRMAAMSGLQTTTRLCLQQCPDRINDITATTIVGGICKQLGEKLDAVRLHAGKCLEMVLSYAGLPLASHDLLCQAFRLDSSQSSSSSSSSITSTNWADAKTTFPMLMMAANADEMFPYIIDGVVISVGALTESVTKSAEEALLAWIRQSSKNDDDTLGRADKFNRGESTDLPPPECHSGTNSKLALSCHALLRRPKPNFFSNLPLFVAFLHVTTTHRYSRDSVV